MRSLIALSLCSLPFAAAFSEEKDAYLLTSFRGDGDGLHLAYSYDAKDWTDLDTLYLKPTVGAKLLRDPHILRAPDGKYHAVWTSGWSDLGIGYATSTNLQDWSEQRFLPLMENHPGAKLCWAPELYFDEQRRKFLIVWSSAIESEGQSPQFRAYYSLTSDFESFTAPAILFDPGFNNIDTTLLKRGSEYYAIYKETDDQPAKNYGSIHVARAKDILGPYEPLDAVVLEKEQAEGPTVVDTGEEVLVYFDYYTARNYGARSTLDWSSWQPPAGDFAFPEGQRHGSIFQAPASLVESLRAQAASVAPTPILQGEFTADPAIRAFGDRYYVYPTSDRPYWNTKEFAVWSSPNLVDWEKHDVFLDLRNDISWSNNKAWAPDCIERNGKYYFYFCADHNIGVAVGDSPTGPFRDALDRPLVDNEKIKTFSIDPYAFIDDDGQAYLYFGNGTPTVYRLNEDMISFDGEHVEFPLRDFREGIVVFKRNAKYYFMWSIDDARSPDYRVGWGVSDSPYGPVQTPPDEKDFIVLRQNGPAQGTAHHSIVNVPGTDRWYVAYHRHAVPGGGGYKRETCLVRMEFDDAGNILPMDPMQPAFTAGDKGEPIAVSR